MKQHIIPTGMNANTSIANIKLFTSLVSFIDPQLLESKLYNTSPYSNHTTIIKLIKLVNLSYSVASLSDHLYGSNTVNTNNYYPNYMQ